MRIREMSDIHLYCLLSFCAMPDLQLPMIYAYLLFDIYMSAICQLLHISLTSVFLLSTAYYMLSAVYLHSVSYLFVSYMPAVCLLSVCLQSNGCLSVVCCQSVFYVLFVYSQTTVYLSHRYIGLFYSYLLTVSPATGRRLHPVRLLSVVSQQQYTESTLPSVFNKLCNLHMLVLFCVEL